MKHLARSVPLIAALAFAGAGCATVSAAQVDRSTLRLAAVLCDLSPAPECAGLSDGTLTTGEKLELARALVRKLK